MKVLIVYSSTYGNVYRMAKLVAEGVKEIRASNRWSEQCPNSYRSQ
jgi:NAD(P)H dehydrogenase (quinone)